MLFNEKRIREKWEQIQEESPRNKRSIRTQEELIKQWNKRKKRGETRKSSNRWRNRSREKIINILKNEGALAAGIKILDIGAGPGRFTIPMARIAREVTALEPAAERVKILKENLEKEKIENVNIIIRPWQEIKIGKEEMEDKYDLVFASMTPGIEDPNTIEKMITASNKYCYISTFSGNRWGGAYKELWEHFFAENIGENPGDIVYYINFLYANGYRPTVKFFTDYQRQYTPEEAVSRLLSFFWRYRDINFEDEQFIKNYVEENTSDGVFTKTPKSCSGMLLWNVNENYK